MSIVSQIIVWVLVAVMVYLVITALISLFALAHYAFKELRGDKHD